MFLKLFIGLFLSVCLCEYVATKKTERNYSNYSSKISQVKNVYNTANFDHTRISGTRLLKKNPPKKGQIHPMRAPHTYFASAPYPFICGNNERYSKCPGCDQCAFRNVLCTKIDCVPGCTCIKGYLRNAEGVCVPEDYCEPTTMCTKPKGSTETSNPNQGCSENEVFDSCIYDCPPETCEALGIQFKCPPSKCHPGCKCKKNYKRVIEKTGMLCIPIENCPVKSCGANEIWEVCRPTPLCVNENCNQSIPKPPCMYDWDGTCVPKCFCQPGYCRDLNGQCVESRSPQLPSTLTPSPSPSTAVSQACVPNSRWMPHRCQECFCNSEGTSFECLWTPCQPPTEEPPTQSPEPFTPTQSPTTTVSQVCIPNSTWRPERCKECYCNSQGTGSNCLWLPCPPPTPEIPTPTKPPSTISPSTSKPPTSNSPKPSSTKKKPPSPTKSPKTTCPPKSTKSSISTKPTPTKPPGPPKSPKTTCPPKTSRITKSPKPTTTKPRSPPKTTCPPKTRPSKTKKPPSTASSTTIPQPKTSSSTPHSPTSSVTPKCVPKSTWKPDPCRECVCNVQGTDFTCWNVPCQPPTPPKVPMYASPPRSSTTQKPTTLAALGYTRLCTPRSIWRPTPCIECYCNEDGSYFYCVDIPCTSKTTTRSTQNLPIFARSTLSISTSKPKVCEPRSIWNAAPCIRCYCNDDGTNYYCVNIPCTSTTT